MPRGSEGNSSKGPALSKRVKRHVYNIFRHDISGVKRN